MIRSSIRAPTVALVLLLSGLAPPASGQLPQADGWVTDQAGLLSDAQERELEQLMESYRSGTTHEIALLTVPTLGDRSLEDLALEVARAWGLGTAETSNGALLLVARDERVLRIEVGRGLEGELPDIVCGRIIRDVITPAFKRGDFGAGLRAGVEAIHAAIGGDYGPIERARRGAPGGMGAVVFMVLLLFVFMFMRRAAFRRRGRLGGGLGSPAGAFWLGTALGGRSRGWGGGVGGGGMSGFSGFGGGGGFSGGGASGGW